MPQGGTTRLQVAPVVGERSPVGGSVLALLARSLIPSILRALDGAPLRLNDLAKQLGWSPQTTLRTRLTTLGELGAVVKRPCGQMPYAVTHELTPLGQEMLVVSGALDTWLARSPHRCLELESEAGRAAVKALAGGWESAIVRALAARPLTLSQIDEFITGMRYPTLERRLSSMRAMGLVEPVPSDERGTSYAVTDWMRRGMAPLAVAVRCERRHLQARTCPATSIDIEIAFLLTLPLLELPPSASGACQLGVHFGANGRPPAGVHAIFERGKPVSYLPGLDPNPATWAIGSALDWLKAVIDGDGVRLRIGGRRPALARQLLEGLHAVLFQA